MKKYILISVFIIGSIVLWSVSRPGSVGQADPVSSTDSPTQTLPDGTEQIFVDPNGNFSFSYDAPYILTRVEDGTYEAVLVQKEGSGLQVYITDFVDSGVFNAARVKKEVGGNLQNLQDIEMPGGFPAVTFSTRTSQGDEWDVWFVAGQGSAKTLYQITVDPGHDGVLKKLVESWRFEE